MQGDRRGALAQVRHDLREDEAAHAVIQGAADDVALAELLGGIRVDGGMADAQAHLQDLLGGGGANIHIEVVRAAALFPRRGNRGAGGWRYCR